MLFVARNTYGKEKWAEIVCGPEPFTPEEEELIERRRRFHWRLIGVDRWEIICSKSQTLPIVRYPSSRWAAPSEDCRLNGAIRLNVGQVQPGGETAILHAKCYKGLVPTHEIEAFAPPRSATGRPRWL